MSTTTAAPLTPEEIDAIRARVEADLAPPGDPDAPLETRGGSVFVCTSDEVSRLLATLDAKDAEIDRLVEGMRERAARKLEEIADRQAGDDPWEAVALKSVAGEIRALPLRDASSSAP